MIFCKTLYASSRSDAYLTMNEDEVAERGYRILLDALGPSEFARLFFKPSFAKQRESWCPARRQRRPRHSPAARIFSLSGRASPTSIMAEPRAAPQRPKAG